MESTFADIIQSIMYVALLAIVTVNAILKLKLNRAKLDNERYTQNRRLRSDAASEDSRLYTTRKCDRLGDSPLRRNDVGSD